MKKPDLTEDEQNGVRGALRFLRVRCGGWKVLATILGYRHTYLVDTAVAKRSPITPTLAFRVARLAKVSIDDLLQGKFPTSGACPHCGHVPEVHLEGDAS